VTLQKMLAEAVVDKNTQRVRLKGTFDGQVVEVTLAGTTLTIDVPPNCVNPFEIRAKVKLEASTNIADVFNAQGGANVDPTRIGGCVGRELEAALRKITNEYKNLGGYSANYANAQLKKLGLSASRDFEKAKNTARNTANSANNLASNALREAENAFKGFGKKKKHKKGPDPRFASSVFDWDYYYDNRPDVLDAGIDPATHWRDSGFAEGAQGSPEFSAVFYRQRYADVAALCGRTDYQCVLQHWLDYGLRQGRQGSEGVSIASYLNRYADLRSVYGVDNYEDAMEHWLTAGEDEKRDPRPDTRAAGALNGPLQAGGGGGGDWSDAATCDGRAVSGWRIGSGRAVDRVQFKYGSNWAPAQGGGNFNNEVALASGEYVVKVDYRAGARLDSVTFYTNKNKTYGPYGGGGGGPGSYVVSPGEKLGCMRGRAGKSIDQMTFSSTGPR
jgi:hypothetical protein